MYEKMWKRGLIMSDWNSYLSRCVEQYYGECRPEYDGDGDPVNCMECDNKDCEFWHEYHENR